MTEQGGALARLRQKIKALAKAEQEYGIAAMQHPLKARDAVLFVNEKLSALDAELAAVEARIGRLVRFVRADDALMGIVEAGDFERIHDEYRAARAAISAEDVA